MGCLFFVFAVWARDPASCTQSGFEEGLSCQTCERLFQLTTNEELHNQCLACCQEEGEERVTQAERGVLVWSEWNQRSFPHIQEFVDRYASQFPAFSHRFSRYARPTLELLDARDKLMDALRIDHWETEDLREFLSRTLTLLNPPLATTFFLLPGEEDGVIMGYEGTERERERGGRGDSISRQCRYK